MKKEPLVIEHRNGNSIDFEMTEQGMAELKKFNKTYVENTEWPYLNSNDTYSKQSKNYAKWHCLVCDSPTIARTIEFGWAPRYAVCKRHEGYLLIASNIEWDTKNEK
jgi:hypothetical protein